MFKRLNEKLQKYVESNLPEIQKLDVICINRLYDLTSKIYVGKKANTWSIFRDKRENGEYNYYRISPRFDKEKEAIEWYANNLLDQYGEEDLYKALKSGNIKVVNDELKSELGISSFKNESVNEANLKPYKFTVDYGDSRPEDFIAYGLDAEDAKRDLYDEYSYLKKHDIKITNVEEVPEDHEEVTLPFTMIHRSSEGPDASGEVTFFPTPFGYEYQCTEKDFNGKGPQWSTIRTIEGIKIWFRNVLFEFGAKTVTIGDETWDIDDFPKNEAYNDAFDNNRYLVSFKGCENQVFVAKSEEEAKEKAKKDFFCKDFEITDVKNLGPITEPKNEEIQLVDKADPDFQLGDAYIAKNKEDLINGLDKLTLGDTIGAFVNYLDEDGVTGELNVEMVDEDLFKISMEEYTKENADDWEGKDVLDTEFLTKEETIYQLNLILEHWEILDKLNEDRLFPTKIDTLPKKDAKFNVGDKVNINGINGEIIKVKPMKMSDTATYQIKLDNGKTIWRYEEEINESLNEDDITNQEDEILEPIIMRLERKLNPEQIDKEIAKFQEFRSKNSDIKAQKDYLEKVLFSYNESLNEAEGIYSPKLILQAYKKEQEWLKENNYEIGETPDIQLFIIENNEIIGCTYVPRKDVYTYQPEENEYYLDMVRDSGDVLTDYNLEPAQKLVDKWNESKQWESLKDYKEVGKILQNKKDGGFNVAEENEPMLTEDQPTLKSLLNNLAKYL